MSPATSAAKPASRRAEGPTNKRSDVVDVFPKGAPDVAIAGVDVARATIRQREVDDPDHRSPDGLHWDIHLSLTGNDRIVALVFGDLLVHDKTWIAAATALVMIDFRDPKAGARAAHSSESALNAVLGPWAAHVLYDTAAAAIRRMVGGTSACHLQVPRQTPVPTPDACG